jgi:uncharacterized protein with LGFP repeats
MFSLVVSEGGHTYGHFQGGQNYWHAALTTPPYVTENIF